MNNKQIRKKERGKILSFLEKYRSMNDEERREVCLDIDVYKDGVKRPYSWDVVWMEITQNTELGNLMLNIMKKEK